MSRYRGCAWYCGIPIPAELNPDIANSFISEGFFNSSPRTNFTATPSGTLETRSVSGPVFVETWRGVYVTTLPLHVEKTARDAVVLGQDWILAACCKLRMDGTMDGWAGSWGTDTCAWFSCAYHPESRSSSPLWPWGRLAINWIHNKCLSDRRRDTVWRSCGIVTSTLLSGPHHATSQPSASVLQRRATAADIPLEVFDNIIEYIDTDEHGSSFDRWGKPIPLDELAISVHVCVRWAQLGRKVMYAERGCLMGIRSAEALRDLQGLGSTRLTHALKLGSALSAHQSWGNPSWIHNIYSAHFDRDRNKLRLWGPHDGSHLPAWTLRSPHWSVPKTLPSRYTNFSRLYLEDVHFPALSDFAKLIKHFVRTVFFKFWHVTWDVPDLTIPSRSRSHNLKPLMLETSGCTNNDTLKSQTQLILDKANIPYFRLPTPEQDACLQVLAALKKCTNSSRHEKEMHLLSHVVWNFFEHCIKLRWTPRNSNGVTFHLNFLYDWTSGVPLVKAICFLATHDTPLDDCAKYYAILHAELQTGRFSSLAVVSLEFDQLEELQYALNHFPDLRAFRSLDGRAVSYRLYCSRLGLRLHPQFQDMETRYSWWESACIDPESMQLTGTVYMSKDRRELIDELKLRGKPKPAAT